ncbi:hypothetical protein [Novosphingobium sp. BL-52-GroH]|uniref:hypothetical protein n=1 Tax=Novosphingobium sp. BL-52-GroH TaxID=3349877 RepID=UPI00384F1CC5
MTRAPSRPPLALLAATLAFVGTGCAADAPPPPPVSGGPITTLPLGTYTCEMPGDAGGAPGKPVADHEFRIVNSSSYKVGAVRGSYLFVGDRVTMTGGTLKGLKLHRISSTFLRQVKEDGSDGEMRCVLTSHR